MAKFPASLRPHGHISITELQYRWQITGKVAIKKLIAEGLLKATRTIGSKWWISMESVEDVEAFGNVPAGRPGPPKPIPRRVLDEALRLLRAGKSVEAVAEETHLPLMRVISLRERFIDGIRR